MMEHLRMNPISAAVAATTGSRHTALQLQVPDADLAYVVIHGNNRINVKIKCCLFI